MKKYGFPRLMGLGLAVVTLGSGVGLGAQALAQPEPVWYNCLTREVFTPEKQAWCDRWQVLQNGTYTVPTSLDPDPEYTPVTLENGRYQQADGTFIVELVNEKNWLAFGDVNDDGKTDAAVIFGVALDPNGRAIATYLTTVLDVDGAAQALNPVRLGERIVLNGPIAIDNSRVTVPQILSQAVVNRTFGVESTTLSELAQLPGPTPVTPDSTPDGTLLLAQTTSYAVRLYSQNGQTLLNLYNKKTGTLALNAVPVTTESIAEGRIYRHAGQPTVQIDVLNGGALTLAVNGTELQDHDQVTGVITYQPRIALPPNAVVEVSLVDVSRADAPAIVLASQKGFTAGRQVPLPFTLIYAPDQIEPRYSYAVQARITVEGQLRFINTSRIPVITQNHPSSVEVVVEPVSR